MYERSLSDGPDQARRPRDTLTRERPPTVQRRRANLPTPPRHPRTPEPFGAQPDRFGVLASVIAIAILLGMLLLPPFTRIPQLERTIVHATVDGGRRADRWLPGR